MTGGRCPALEAGVAALRSAGAAFALVHESALMGWGIDNNVFLDHVDALLLDDAGFSAFGLEAPSEPGGFSEAEVAGVPLRLWSRASLGLGGPVEVTSCPRYGCEALAPELVLRKLPFSPDACMLAEQRARLAAVLFVDSLTDEELSLVARYVRGV